MTYSRKIIRLLLDILNWGQGPRSQVHREHIKRNIFILEIYSTNNMSTCFYLKKKFHTSFMFSMICMYTSSSLKTATREGNSIILLLFIIAQQQKYQLFPVLLWKIFYLLVDSSTGDSVHQSRLARQDLLRRRDINLYTGLHPRLLHGAGQ